LLIDLRQVAPVGIVADERGTRTPSVVAALALLAFIAFAIFDDIRGVPSGAANGFEHHEQSVGIGTFLFCCETQV